MAMNNEVDGWISQLMQCKPLSEAEVKKLCDKVSEDCPGWSLYSWAIRRGKSRNIGLIVSSGACSLVMNAPKGVWEVSRLDLKAREKDRMRKAGNVWFAAQGVPKSGVL